MIYVLYFFTLSLLIFVLLFCMHLLYIKGKKYIKTAAYTITHNTAWIPQCCMFLRPSVYGLKQYGQLKGSCPFCCVFFFFFFFFFLGGGGRGGCFALEFKKNVQNSMFLLFSIRVAKCHLNALERAVCSANLV